MIKPVRALPALPLLVVAAVMVGCGGGGGETTSTPAEPTTEAGLTKQELIAQGDAICAEVNAAVGTVSSSAGAEGASRIAQEADLYSGMVERLKGLGAPSDGNAGYSQFIGAAEELAQVESDARLAAERGEEGGLAEAESRAETALSSFQEAAESYGFEDCSEAPSAPTPRSSEEGGVESSPEGEAEEAAPEEAEPAPEEAEPAPEEAGGGAAPGGGGTEGGGTEGSGGGSSGGIGPG